MGYPVSKLSNCNDAYSTNESSEDGCPYIENVMRPREFKFEFTKRIPNTDGLKEVVVLMIVSFWKPSQIFRVGDGGPLSTLGNLRQSEPLNVQLSHTLAVKENESRVLL
jgi:hypothetical protein